MSVVAADYAVIACMLFISLGVGIFLAIRGRKKRSKDDYLLGNRNLHVVPVTLSLFVTFMSSNSLIGFPAETYSTGTHFYLASVGIGLSYVVGIFTVIPVMHPLKVTSMYEYFHIRFRSPGLRLLVTIVAMIQKIIFTAVVLLSPALSIQTGTGLPFWVSVVIVGGVGIIYTSIGGIRGIVLVDVFQAAVIATGIVSVLIKAVIDTGGMEATWSIAKAGKRVQPVDFGTDPRSDNTFWPIVIGGMFSVFAYTFDQSAVQRVCAIPTMTGAKIVYAVNSVVTGVYILAVSFMGTVAYSYFARKGCDPFKSRSVTNNNQLVPFLVMSVFKDLPGMTGLYLAALFSGALSTVSSIVNGLAANTIEDLLRIPFKKYNVSETIRIRIAQLTVFAYGCLCIGLAFVAKMAAGSLIRTAVAVIGSLGGPIAGIFFLGAMVPWANKIGATVGVLLSLALNIWLSIGKVLYGRRQTILPPPPGNACLISSSNSDIINRTTTIPPSIISTNVTAPLSVHTVPEPSVYDISSMYYGLTGWLVSCIVGILVSLITHKWCKQKTEERLLFPFVRILWRSTCPKPVTDTANVGSDLRRNDIYSGNAEGDIFLSTNN